MITLDNRRVVAACVLCAYCLLAAGLAKLEGQFVVQTLFILAGALFGSDAYDMRQRRLDTSSIAEQVAACAPVVADGGTVHPFGGGGDGGQGSGGPKGP